MAILRDFERRLEGAVEGFFARAFRSGLQPVELAKALQRYAGNYQQVGIDGVFVPNVYRIELSPEDAERFSGFDDSLRRELAGVLRRTARERGWKLQGPVRIELQPNPGVAVGTYELRGKVEAAPEEPSEQRVPAPGATAVMPAQEPRALLEVLDGPDPGQRQPLAHDAIIGRLPQSDITLDDPSVSRRHARVLRTASGWLIEDLGSTNGVRVNGRLVDRAHLRHGDSIELGSVRLAFALED